ncbi:hypothetical protein [Carnobacterium funditum]|nr:hypothetical protein [Carnobacterium funditum]
MADQRTERMIKMSKLIKRMLVSFIVSYVAARVTSFLLKEEKTEPTNK